MLMLINERRAERSQQQQHAIKSNGRQSERARDGGPRGWVHYATYLRTVCTVWRGKIGTTGETPGSHVLEAAEDGQCDGRGGCGFADGVGEKKIKKRAAGPTQGRAEKKEDQDMGVIASGCRIAWHMGPFGGVSGTVQTVQCGTHRPYLHQGSCDI